MKVLNSQDPWVMLCILGISCSLSYWLDRIPLDFLNTNSDPITYQAASIPPIPKNLLSRQDRITQLIKEFHPNLEVLHLTLWISSQGKFAGFEQHEELAQPLLWKLEKELGQLTFLPAYAEGKAVASTFKLVLRFY
ncbi:MAG: hypothetical protein AAFY71_21820 [Bacteroidota bacterium]